MQSESGRSVAPPAPVPLHPALEFLDLLIMVAALVIGAYVLLRWIQRQGRDPLVNAPRRLNRVNEAGVLFPFLAYMVGAALIAAIVGRFFEDHEDVRADLWVGNGAHLLGLAACMVVAAKSFEGGLRSFFGWGIWRRRGSAIRLLAFILLAWGISPLVRDATWWVVVKVWPTVETHIHPTLVALHGDQPGWVVAGLWIGAAGIAPLAEELFFRGLLQTFLANLLQSRWAAILMVASAFGCVHISQVHAVIPLVFLGTLLGYAYEKTGSLVAPVIIHAAFNLKTLVWESMARLQ